MKKKLLVLAIPALVTTLVVTSCGKNGEETSSSTPVQQTTSSVQTPTSTPTVTPTPVAPYTYGAVKTMKGAINLNIMGFTYDVPMTLKYQTANEDFDLNRITQYVKFSMDLDFGTAASNYMITVMAQVPSLLAGLFDETQYLNFLNTDESNAIQKVSFNYNADGKLYTSFIGSDDVTQDSNGNNVYNDPVSYGTAMTDVNAVLLGLIGQIGGLVGDIGGLVGSFTDLGSLDLSNITIPNITIDVGQILALLTAFTVSISDQGFSIDLTQNGGYYLAEMLPELLSPLLGGMPLDFEISGGYLSYSVEDHFVDFKIMTPKNLYDDVYVDSPIASFEIKDSDEVNTSVFGDFDYEAAYTSQQTLLNSTEIKTMIDVYNNIQYTAEYGEVIDAAITAAQPIVESDPRIGSMFDDTHMDVEWSPIPGYIPNSLTAYMEGYDLVVDFKDALEDSELDLTKIDEWTVADWSKISKEFDACRSFALDPRGDEVNILEYSEYSEVADELAGKFTEISYETFDEIKDTALALFAEIKSASDISGDKALEYVNAISKFAFYNDEGSSLTQLSSVLAPRLGEIFTEDNIAYMSYVYKLANDRIVSLVNAANSNVSIKTLTDAFTAVTKLYNSKTQEYNSGSFIAYTSSYVISYLRNSNYASKLSSFATKLHSSTRSVYDSVNSPLGKNLIAEMDKICTSAAIEAATEVSVLEGYKTALQTMFSDTFGFIFDSGYTSMTSAMNTSRFQYNSRIQAIDNRIAALTPDA